jgi:hypothetical protein
MNAASITAHIDADLLYALQFDILDELRDGKEQTEAHLFDLLTNTLCYTEEDVDAVINGLIEEGKLRPSVKVGPGVVPTLASR